LEIAGGRNSESARAFKSEQVSVGLFKNLLRLPVQILDKQTPEPNTPEGYKQPFANDVAILGPGSIGVHRFPLPVTFASLT
jgi:hypothetical protein